MKGRAVKTGFLLALVTAALMLFPIGAADISGTVRVLNQDTSNERAVIAGEQASFGWIVYNFGNISSYNVKSNLDGTYGNWELSIEPKAFTIAPDSAQKVALRFQSKKSNLGESFNINIRFNITEVTGSPTPISYEVAKNVSVTVVARQVIDEHGITILGNHFGLPGFMDNDWGRFVLMIVIWLIVGALAVGVIELLRWVASRTETKYDDIILDIVRVPTLLVIVLYGMTNSLSHIRIDAETLAWITRGYYIGLILVIAYVGYKIFKGVLIVWLRDFAKKSDTKLDDVLVPIFDKIGTVGIIIVTGIFLLSYFGVNVTVFIAGLGVAGLVVAFAAQDTLSNFFAGIFLLMDRPFSLGDTIVMENGDYCEVLHVGLRSTRLYDIFTQDLVVMPNNKLANMNIVNVSRPDKREKVTLEIRVGYESDLEKVEKTMLEAVENNPNVDKEICNTPVIRLSSFGESAPLYKIYFTVDDWNNRWRVSHEIRKEILARFRKEGIQIPLPESVIHMKKQ